MKGIRKTAFIWLQLIVLLVIWAIVLWAFRTESDIWKAIVRLPTAVAVYSVLLFVFVKWLWRLRIFRRWLVITPDLQGTWKGTLKSTWTDPDVEQKIAPKDVTLVIKQTLLTISCVMYTDESKSFSNAAQINKDNEHDFFELSYNFTNFPEANIRDRSPIHNGAAILKIIDEPKRVLEGEYWTSRKTTGDIRLEFFSKKLHQAHS